ncbi:thioredoxin domain-containing protein [Rubrivivax gelatinosus]|uniref:thioredoxin domain-containing protein n=1 Tax=Rubrivivax gelatinosus TaxID=28068 RepID=UPI001ED92CC3|nr:thioredoxin domain-containing protein [Rubrivivax gelatinosus]
MQPRPEDRNAALIFFDFSCPVCASLHEPLSQWGATLPRQWRAEFVPVALPNKESAMAAMAYYAAARANPGRLVDFMNAAYRRIHRNKQRAGEVALWEGAARDAGITNFSSGWAAVHKGQLEEAMRKLLVYGVEATPSVVIGGRYIVSPDNTNGDTNLFLQLCSGMVSKSMGFIG